MDADRPRCFVALVPDGRSRDALAALPVGTGARRTPPAQLHLTLAFAGAIERATAAQLAGQVPALADGAALPPLAVERLVRWPGGARARLVVAELARPAELMALHAQLEAALEALGVAVERHAFRPHVTLARLVRDAARADAAPLRLDAAIEVRFASLTFYESVLLPAGALHRPLASAALTA
jgi:RNA 2',3'-cyclic 3'-phosphodiesterase